MILHNVLVVVAFSTIQPKQIGSVLLILPNLQIQYEIPFPYMLCNRVIFTKTMWNNLSGLWIIKLLGYKSLGCFILVVIHSQVKSMGKGIYMLGGSSQDISSGEDNELVYMHSSLPPGIYSYYSLACPWLICTAVHIHCNNHLIHSVATKRELFVG